MYPYTMRHGKYFDETIFFSFYTAIGILLLRGGIYIYSLSESMTRDDESLFCRIICRAPIESSRTIRDEQVNILRLH